MAEDSGFVRYAGPAAYDDPAYVDPAAYTGSWDNLFILAKPAG